MAPCQSRSVDIAWKADEGTASIAASIYSFFRLIYVMCYFDMS